MYPAIDCSSGDNIYSGFNMTVVYNTKNVSVGEIVVYKAGALWWKYPYVKSAFVVHRVINKTTQGYITKGDNNQSPDPWIVKPWWISWRIA